jgi:transposase
MHRGLATTTPDYCPKRKDCSMALPISSLSHCSPKKRLFIGIDIGKATHSISFFAERDGKPMPGRVYRITNDLTGFEKFYALLCAQKANECRALVEKTGHYGDSLIEFLGSKNIDVYSISIQKRMLSDKTDERDARLLSEMLYQQTATGFVPMEPEKRIRRIEPDCQIAQRIRGPVRRHHELTKSITRTKNRLRELQNRAFPEFTEALEDPNGATALIIRKRFPTAADVAAAPIADLLACRMPRAKKPSNQTFLKLQSLARRSVGVKTQPLLVLEQSQLIDTILLLEAQVGEIEAIIGPCIEESREGRILRSLGMGRMQAAYIIVGIGNIENFKKPSSLGCYFGWTPRRTQTGTTVNKSRFSRSGNRMLKSTMYFVIGTAIKNNTEWKRIYSRLVERMCPMDGTGKRTGKMRVMARIANQMIRLIWLLLQKDAELMKTLPAGVAPPAPALYDASIHRAHINGGNGKKSRKN